MIETKIDDSGFTFVINELSKNAQNTAPLMRKISGDMMDSVEENFEREGRPRWKSLAESTIESRKKKKKWPGKILQVTGRLAKSIIVKTSKFEAVLGTNLKYARIHQKGGVINMSARSETFVRSRYIRGAKKGKFKKGTKSGRGFTFGSHSIKIPARPYLKISNNELSGIENRILNHLMKGVT